MQNKVYEKLPKISIITPSFNQGQFLEETIRSVLSQNYPNLEYIIIDGGSTDGSIDIIKNYENYLSYWISEPDNGQAQAINKGLRMATGEIFNWINSDDILVPGTLWEIVNEFQKHPGANLICGYYTAFTNGTIYPKMRMKVFPELEKTLVNGHVSPCCMFYRLSALKDLLHLDERFHYCMDLELWHRHLELYGTDKLVFIQKNLVFFRFHTNSKTIKFRERFYQERYNILFSILNSNSEKILGKKLLSKLDIPKFYHKNWSIPSINYSRLCSYFLQDMMDNLTDKFTYSQFISAYFISLFLNPLGRDIRFYLLPVILLKRKISSANSKSNIQPENNHGNCQTKILINHYLTETALARKLIYASKNERQVLYSQVYDELYSKFPHLKLSINNPKKCRRYIKGQVRLLNKYIDPSIQFLEIGPGDCSPAMEIAKKVYRVHVIDVSRKATEIVEIPDNFEMIISDGVSIPLPENSIDLAYSNQLMEHLHPEDAKSQIRNIYKVLKSGGKYLCLTPYLLGGPYDVSSQFDEEPAGFHLKEYSWKEIENLFKGTGFKRVLALIGAFGLYLSIPVSYLIKIEKILFKLPYKTRKNFSNVKFVTWIMGIKIIGYK